MKMKLREDGITLTEVLVVAAIVGILAMAMAFSFKGWYGRYNVEKTMNNIYTDLVNAQARAMQRSVPHIADLPSSTTYRVANDTNGNGTIDNTEILFPTDTVTGLREKRVDHPLTWAGGLLNFDQRGMITRTDATNPLNILPLPLPATICMFTDFDADPNHKSDFDPDYDCIIISQTRIALGKLTKQDTDGGICAPTNLPTADPNYNANNACQQK
jgi:prepilin-type N-terminal cleavage/methylation domain-containing protein